MADERNLVRAHLGEVVIAAAVGGELRARAANVPAVGAAKRGIAREDHVEQRIQLLRAAVHNSAISADTRTGDDDRLRSQVLPAHIERGAIGYDGIAAAGAKRARSSAGGAAASDQQSSLADNCLAVISIDAAQARDARIGFDDD